MPPTPHIPHPTPRTSPPAVCPCTAAPLTPPTRTHPNPDPNTALTPHTSLPAACRGIASVRIPHPTPSYAPVTTAWATTHLQRAHAQHQLTHHPPTRCNPHTPHPATPQSQEHGPNNPPAACPYTAAARTAAPSPAAPSAACPAARVPPSAAPPPGPALGLRPAPSPRRTCGLVIAAHAGAPAAWAVCSSGLGTQAGCRVSVVLGCRQVYYGEQGRKRGLGRVWVTGGAERRSVWDSLTALLLLLPLSLKSSDGGGARGCQGSQ